MMQVEVPTSSATAIEMLQPGSVEAALEIPPILTPALKVASAPSSLEGVADPTKSNTPSDESGGTSSLQQWIDARVLEIDTQRSQEGKRHIRSTYCGGQQRRPSSLKVS